MQFQDVLRKRRMVRNFTDEPIPDDVIERIIEAGQHAPSAGFSQGVVYVVVTDEETRREIARIGGEEWSARSYDPDLQIPAGTRVDVFAIEGATALVHPQEEPWPN